MILRRLVAAIVLLLLGGASIGIPLSRAAKSCSRCGPRACCAPHRASATCSVKSSCCDPDPDERIKLEHGAKPGLLPGDAQTAPALPYVLAAGEYGGAPSRLPRPPVDPPPRGSSASSFA